ncbi:helix-turn-helix transcriptional regulator [Oscillibacter sp.]|uniref:helix-turn-helix domain-containing protein n=1 Tax=Oscillibacter sp. TaxID=1945593 RepID=UPI00260F5821|nr:helix-turn-helix transcriptional regulator [Oscillibacter sp.]MDD3346249.1 helix-turn-helix transcriptional regulator [Oscillibacter sp.]
MITMAQRIEALRTEKGVSRPALSAALGFPKSAAEKFETGRQTPSQDQQQKLASYFGVSLFYLRGESDDRTQMENWLNSSFSDDVPAAPATKRQPTGPRTVAQSSGAGKEDGPLLGAFLKSSAFGAMVRATVLGVLRSPEGEELLSKAVRRELERR